jgi:hypothetical protein
VTRADNSHHLAIAARTRSRTTRERSLAAIQTMIDTGQEITFDAVATTAGVSRSWLYGAADLRDRIIELRAMTRSTTKSPPPPQRATETSLLTRLEVTQERLRQVTADNAALRAQLEQALGVIRAERQGLNQK